MPVWVTFSVAVLVYEKNGLKRGPGITNATFRSYPPDQPYNSFISWTFRPPLGGYPAGTPIYQVDIQAWRWEDRASDPFNLSVSAGGYYAEWYPVRNGQSFEARLQRV
jgi:hypothetical protein